MRECIHAGRAGDMRRQANSQLRIKNCVMRNEAEILYRIFVMRRAVGHNSGDGRLGAGTRSRRHGKERRKFLEHAERSAHLRDALARLDHARSGNLCAVHRGTAAKGDNAVALVVHI